MRTLEALRMAFEAIRAHKLRGFFTVLGTVFGVTFLIAVITMIEGMNQYVEKQVKGVVYGVNTVTLRRFPSITTDGDEGQWRSWQRRPRLSFDDAEWLEARMQTPGTLALSASSQAKARGPRGRTIENVQVTGATASYFQVREMVMTDGRAFSRNEADRGLPVVVIGQDVAQALFEGRNPVGQEIRIRNFPYRVIGVIAKQGKLFNFSLDNVAIAPIRSAVSRSRSSGPGSMPPAAAASRSSRLAARISGVRSSSTAAAASNAPFFAPVDAVPSTRDAAFARRPSSVTSAAAMPPILLLDRSV